MSKKWIKEEKWYFYNPESDRFKPIEFEKIPNNPGYILLRYVGAKDNEYFLDLFSPSGELLLCDEGHLDDKKSNKYFEDKIKYLLKLSHKLCS